MNAPWLDRGNLAAGYSPAMFSNPAMRGPAVMLAPRMPPAPPKPTPLPAAPDAFRGVELAITATMPRYERTDTTRALACGPYKLYPAVKRDGAGGETVVYWHAVNRETKRGDFIVGPDALEAFRSDPQKYAEVALRVFANGEPDKPTTESMKVVDAAMSKGPGAALVQLGHAWKVALTDPEWIVRRTTDLATAAAGGSHAPARAARAAEAATAEPVLRVGRLRAPSARRVGTTTRHRRSTARRRSVTFRPHRRGDRPHSIHRCR